MIKLSHGAALVKSLSGVYECSNLLEEATLSAESPAVNVIEVFYQCLPRLCEVGAS